MSNLTSSIWQVTDAVWNMLEANAAFAALVPSDNRIKHTDTTDRNPGQDTRAEADFVSVAIIPAGTRPWAYRTSNGSMLTLTLRFDVHVGDRRIHLWSEPCEAIYKAFTTWQTYLRNQSWQGDDFRVCRCRLFDMQDTLDTDHAMTGWISLMRAEIDIWYQSTDINGS